MFLSFLMGGGYDGMGGGDVKRVNCGELCDMIVPSSRYSHIVMMCFECRRVALGSLLY